MREVVWIIFDEVYYMCDSERGVVWEESIVMVFKNFRFVFFFVIVFNVKEFVDWVVKVIYFCLFCMNGIIYYILFLLFIG